MKISDLKPGIRNVNIEAMMVKKDKPKEITTRYGRTKVSNGVLEDDTDKIDIVLWGEDADKVNEGDKVKVENGYVKNYKGNAQLSVGKYGKIMAVKE